MRCDSKPLFPTSAWVLLGVYFIASLVHFAHNAEFIAFYPNMPVSLTREKVYLAWLAVSSLGVASVLTTWLGWRTVGALLLAAYGALGLDALGHYMLALCSEHTLAANLTIWFEVEAGLALLVAGLILAKRYIVSNIRSAAAAA
jgi:hypothetical protein